MLFLASSSPRRRALLTAAGIEFSLCDPGPEVRGTGSPRERAMQRAASKARGARAPDGALVLGVDTVVVLDGDELGKPRDRIDARRMIHALAGREHEVVSAHCLTNSAIERVALASSRVRCARLASAAVERYLDQGEWSDKAGAYGIQGAAGQFMELLEGDLDTVVGLSVESVRRLLEEVGCRRRS